MPESAVELLIVRGAPGVGKTSAVRRLRKRIPHGAVIEVDTLRGMLASVEWMNRAQHRLALDQALLLAENLFQRDYRPVVIVDTLGRSRLEEFMPLLRWRYRIASLYARNEVLRARIERRPEGEFKQVPPSILINDEVAANRHPHELLIDTTKMTPADVAEALYQQLQGAQ